MEFFTDNGSYTRIPTHKIQLPEGYTSPASEAKIKKIAEQLKAKGRNFKPMMVEEIGEDEYEVFENGYLLEAAKLAGIKFVWCVLVDSEAREMAEMEAI